MKDKEYIKQVMVRFQKGIANPIEKQELLNFLENSSLAERDEIFNEINEANWNNQLSKREESLLAKQDFSEILKRISLTLPPKRKSLPIKSIAVAALLLIFFSFLGWLHFHKSDKQFEESINWSSKTTTKGQKVKIKLSDSSYLAGESTLSWPERFEEGKNRLIKLKGEAFFEVKRDSSSPFIVQTDNMTTQVLGTSFNIYAYPEDMDHSVSVRTGKVRVSTLENNQVKNQKDLLPGMVLTYNQQSKKIGVLNIEDPSTLNGWISNKLIFKNAGFKELSTKLARYYSIKIKEGKCRIDDLQINAKFDNLPIRTILDQLKMMTRNEINYEINSNNEITLWSKGCK